MFGEECQYLSHEHTLRPYTKLVKNGTTGMYDPVGMGKKKVLLGDYCNNHSLSQTGWVEEMHWCPRRWAMRRGIVKGGKKRK